MIYVKRVKSSLKKGTDVELYPLTVIVGANGSGKTTIVQSAELATTGAVSDNEGRDAMRQQSALGRLFHLDVDMFAEAELSDGTVFRWDMKRGKDGAFKKPDHDAPSKVRWPVADLREMLRGEATSVRAWLERQISAGMTPEQMMKPFPPNVRDTVQKLLKKHKKADFVALAKEAKSEAKALRMQATKNEGLLTGMTEGIAPPLLDSEIEKMKVRRDALGVTTGLGVSSVDYALKRSQLETTAERIVEINTEIEKLRSPPAVEAEVEALVLMDSLLQQHIDSFGTDNCQVCGTEGVDLKKRKASVFRARGGKLMQAEALMRRRLLEKERDQLDLQLRKAVQEFKALAVKPEDGERDRLVAAIAQNEVVSRAWVNVTSAQREVFDLRAQADLLTTAVKALETTGKDLLERQKADFESKVTGFLPKGETFAVDLDSTRFGLVRGDEIHSALSGAEWSRVLLALGAAQGAGTAPAVLVPEDRAWSSGVLTDTMKALSDSPVQILIMSTVRPESVEGWHIIDVG